MDNNANTALPEPPVVGYPRAIVDEFVAAADVERVRLVEVIAEAEQRADGARVAIGAHEVMITMLVEAHRDLSARERDAQARAAAILEAADHEAREIVRSAHGASSAGLAVSDAPIATTPIDTTPIDSTPIDRGTSIDLSTLESLDPPSAVILKSPVYANGNGDHHEPASSDRYFDFLRGALADDEPLGPRPE